MIEANVIDIDVHVKAQEKLKIELEKVKDKVFAEPIISYLIKRCEEDKGISEDVLQNHKTLGKCFSYVYSQAKKQAGNQNKCAVRDDVVYEWAEDYYHIDDKAIEEKKAKEEAERKKKQEENTKKVKAIKLEKVEVTEASKVATIVTTKVENKKNKVLVEGQLSLFDMLV